MHYADYKTILSPQNGMNLYRGCTHGCIYCDSRSACYQMKHDFEDIEVKRNAVQILEAQLLRKRKPCMIGTGAMTDPYIPLERDLQITRQCLEVIDRYGFGLAIQTKSADILRDMDLLTSIHKNAKCVVEITLTTMDEALCGILEPAVSTTAKRIGVLREMQKAGIPTVVWLSPILPFINDTEENLLGILEACIQTGVKGILCFDFGLTLREGNREYFYKQLDKFFPGMKEKYIRTFGNQYVCSSSKSAVLMQRFRQECKKHGIISQPQAVFNYMKLFERKDAQLSLFNP